MRTRSSYRKKLKHPITLNRVIFMKKPKIVRMRPFI